MGGGLQKRDLGLLEMPENSRHSKLLPQIMPQIPPGPAPLIDMNPSPPNRTREQTGSRSNI